MSVLFAALFLLFGCDPTPDTLVEAESTVGVPEISLTDHQKNYVQLKNRIQQQRKALAMSRMAQEWKEQRAKEYLSSTLIDSIFPYWKGTKWDFNGITPEPRKGEIACGYFVSTTLRDVGVELNRYKTAQKAAADIVKQLCAPTTIQTCTSRDQLDRYLAEVTDNEILIVGLDFHVGFLYKRDGAVYFAHSNYIGREGVIVERMDTSAAIQASQAYVVGNVSQNKELIDQWLTI